MRILAGDIGGTKTHLAEFIDGIEKRSQIFPSSDYRSLEEVIWNFAKDESFDRAGFGIAGPVQGSIVHTTNLPWVIRKQELQTLLGTPYVRLINDFHAAALGLQSLKANDVIVLQEGLQETNGPCSLIGAGTGLGKAIILPCANSSRILTSEGGHANFAPHCEFDAEFRAWLCSKQGRVSVEQILSGSGMVSLYQYLCLQENMVFDTSIDAAWISNAAKETNSLARKAIECWIRIYGSEAGNFVLNILPQGGLFIAGGIAPKLHRSFESLFLSLFMDAFLDKEPMRSVVEGIHVTLVTQPKLGLWGAARAAQTTTKGS